MLEPIAFTKEQIKELEYGQALLKSSIEDGEKGSFTVPFPISARITLRGASGSPTKISQDGNTSNSFEGESITASLALSPDYVYSWCLGRTTRKFNPGINEDDLISFMGEASSLECSDLNGSSRPNIIINASGGRGSCMNDPIIDRSRNLDAYIEITYESSTATNTKSITNFTHKDLMRSMNGRVPLLSVEKENLDGLFTVSSSVMCRVTLKGGSGQATRLDKSTGLTNSRVGDVVVREIPFYEGIVYGYQLGAATNALPDWEDCDGCLGIDSILFESTMDQLGEYDHPLLIAEGGKGSKPSDPVAKVAKDLHSLISIEVIDFIIEG